MWVVGKASKLLCPSQTSNVAVGGLSLGQAPEVPGSAGLTGEMA